MNLQTQLLEDMKQAMRDKNMVKLGVIRFLRSEIKNFEIDNGDQDDKGIQKVIATQLKKVKDAINDFKKAGREDLVAQEEEKVGFMQSYLPEQLSDNDLEEIVNKIVLESDEKNMGKLIGIVMKEVSGRADGNRVSSLIRSKLQ